MTETQDKAQKRFESTGQWYDSKDTTLEHLYRSTAKADPKIANAANFFGINYYKSGQYVAKPHVGYGHIFFTRPRLNLTHDNLKKNRQFLMMVNSDTGSVLNIIRNYLDPVLANNPKNKMRSPLVDPRNPFISVLTNQCLTASGWPEVPMDPYTSKAGKAGEVYSLADGHPTHYGPYTINCNFENLKHDFINLLFHYWTQYAMHTHAGRFMPYKDDWLLNRINYNTRIYRLLTDPSGMYIVDWACTGASFPINSNKAGIYDYDRFEQHIQSLGESSIQFQCNGMWMMDPIVLRSFNETMLMYNPSLAPAVRKDRWVELTEDIRPFFNHLALPYIDLKSAKLCWYVETPTYRDELKILERK